MTLVVLSPWAFGSVDQFFRLLISLILLALSACWAALLIVTRSWNRRANTPILLLGGLAFLSLLQLIPLPGGFISLTSPGSARVRSEFIPATLEALPGETAMPRPASFPISIFPSESKKYLLQYLAILILFAIAATSFIGPKTFQRLAVAAAINGALLSLLAIAQRFSSRGENLMYWSVESSGTPFGCFGNRNHFSAYVNICACLAIGLLAAALHKRKNFFRNSTAIWLSAAIALMILANMFSLSRGGFMALLVALAMSMILCLRIGRVEAAVGKAIWIVPAVIALGVLYGGTVWDQRLEKTDSSKNLWQGRLDAWRSGLKAVPDFPLFGSGSGTFGFIERMNRSVDSQYFFFYEHAHNEYIDALVEGGLCRLLLTALLIYFVSRLAARNYRDHRDRSLGWIILGALAGFWTLALESLVNFGVQIPAVALLATIASAQMIAARRTESPDHWVRLPRAACAGIGVLTVAIMSLIAWEQRSLWKAEEHANYVLFHSKNANTTSMVGIVEAAQASLASEPDNVMLREYVSRALAEMAMRTENAELRSSLARRSLYHAREARNACPALSEVHLLLAMNRQEFTNAPPIRWYLERACLAEPTNARAWCFLGSERFQAGDVEGACRDWHRSLEISDQYLNLILRWARERMFPDAILEKILPDRPALLLAAANELAPLDPEQPSESRGLYLRKALALLERDPAKRTASDEGARGRILIEMGRGDEGLAALQAGVQKDGNAIPLRLELALELYRRENFHEAKRQAKTVLSFEPHHPRARDLVEMIERDMLITSE